MVPKSNDMRGLYILNPLHSHFHYIVKRSNKSLTK